jgi:hypothetical protein
MTLEIADDSPQLGFVCGVEHPSLEISEPDDTILVVSENSQSHIR